MAQSGIVGLPALELWQEYGTRWACLLLVVNEPTSWLLDSLACFRGCRLASLWLVHLCSPDSWCTLSSCLACTFLLYCYPFASVIPAATQLHLYSLTHAYGDTQLIVTCGWVSEVIRDNSLTT